MRALPFIVLAVATLEARSAFAEEPPSSTSRSTTPTSATPTVEAAPLPSKDVRWSATFAPAIDVGSLPRPAPGLALGFDVRRGALAARLRGSGYLAQRTPDFSVALFDVMALVCALAPIGASIDFGACGGGGVGLLRAVAPEDAASSLRPQGAAELRLDLFPGHVVFVSTEVGAVVDFVRPPVRLAGFEPYRPLAVAFRATIGIHVRFW